MKKNVFLVLMSVLMCAGFVACGSDDDNSNQSAGVVATVGTWVCTASQDWWTTDNGSGSATDVMKGVTLTINSDGTYKSSSSNFGLSGQWSVDGNSFSAKSSSGRVMTGTVTVSGNSMRLKGSTTDGYTFDYSFERKNEIDDNSSQPAGEGTTVGTWVCTASQDWWATGNGSGSATDAMKGVTLTINSDGTYKSSSSNFGLSGQWSVDGNSFSAKSSSGRVMTGTVTVGSNSMRLTGSTTDGYTFDYSFERKK